MSELGDLQRKFTLMVGRLIVWTYTQGYELTLGESYNAYGLGHMKDSLHYSRLAQDLNLFKDKVWLKGEEAEKGYNLMHDFWDSIGGAKRIEKDLNHFSMEYLGRR
jgi:hypothetical protein